MLAAARSYQARGWRPIAIHRVKNGCCSCSKGFRCPSAGKHPVLNEWQSAGQFTDAELQHFFGGDMPYNIGIATGPESNLLVLDVDPKDGGKETLAALRAEYGNDWLKTQTHETGSGGWHFLFSYPDFEVGNSASTKLGPGLDTRGKGGQVVAPPSVSGVGPYVIIRDRDIIAAPEWMLERLRPKERKEVVDVEKAMLEVTPAERARLDGYTEGAVKHEVDRLLALAQLGWNGPPWDITTFEVACNLIQLANAPWSSYTNRQAYEDVYTNAPRDPGFDDVRVNAKFESAERTVGDNQAAYPPKAADAFWLGDDDEPTVTTRPATVATQIDASGDDMDDFASDSNEPEAPEIPQLIAPPHLFGIPVVDGQLDPDWERKARAQLLGTAYREREYVEILPPDGTGPDELEPILAGPVVNWPQIRDLSPFEGWLRASLRSGTPELLYAALRVLVAGTAVDAPTVVFKGGGPLLRVLAHTLRPAVGDDSETMLAGPRISTREVDGPQVVFEFDEREMDLMPYAEAIIDRALASTDTLEPVTSEQHDELEDLTDYRAAQLHRARLGMGSRPREGAEL